MSHTHDLARRFVAALSGGAVPDDLLTDDMTAWTTSSGADIGRARYQGGVRLLAGLFDGPYRFTIDTLTAEDDRVAVEARAEGRLRSGGIFANRYVFLLRLRDGRIAHVAEHFDPTPVHETLRPLIQAAMAQAAG